MTSLLLMMNNFFVQSIVDINTANVKAVTRNTNDFNNSDFHWSYITPLMIHNALRKHRSNAVGLDSVSPKLIKLVLPCLIPIIEHIFNFSLMNGVFPDTWKPALVCPVLKIKNPTVIIIVQYYRSISILSAFFKTLERLIYDQICNYSEHTDLFDQSAY